MLIEKHDCYNLLLKYENECTDLITEMINNNTQINDKIIKFLIGKNENLPVVEHYNLLNQKAHKIIKEILNCDGKDVATYIKIATSLITQGTITLEHKFNNSAIKDANNFIKCTRLPELSEALSIYFNTNNFKPLVYEVNNIKKDIKLIIDLQ